MFDYSRFTKLKDPSGLWNPFIAEEGSFERAQGAVYYLCQGGAKKGLLTFLMGEEGRDQRQFLKFGRNVQLRYGGHYFFVLRRGMGSSCFLDIARDS